MYDLMEPSEIVRVKDPLVAHPHLLTMDLYVTSNRSIDPDTVQVIARVVAVRENARRLLTGPGGPALHTRTVPGLNPAL